MVKEYYGKLSRFVTEWDPLRTCGKLRDFLGKGDVTPVRPVVAGLVVCRIRRGRDCLIRERKTRNPYLINQQPERPHDTEDGQNNNSDI
jgi:hypothetical protein